MKEKRRRYHKKCPDSPKHIFGNFVNKRKQKTMNNFSIIFFSFFWRPKINETNLCPESFPKYQTYNKIENETLINNTRKKKVRWKRREEGTPKSALIAQNTFSATLETNANRKPWITFQTFFFDFFGDPKSMKKISVQKAFQNIRNIRKYITCTCIDILSRRVNAVNTCSYIS